MRRKLRLRLCLSGVILLLALLLLMNLRWFPTLRRLVRMQAENETSNRINEAMAAYLDAHALTYAELVRLETDANGTVTAMQLNMDAANRLRAWLLAELDRRIPDMTGQDLAVPVGNVLFPALLSGRGGSVPVRVVSLRATNAELESRFTAEGVNQTLHTLELAVSVDALLLTPAGFLDLHVDTRVPVAQTVIVGAVPATLIKTGD